MRLTHRIYNYKSRSQMNGNKIHIPPSSSHVTIPKYKFTNSCLPQNKINFIDHIVWINLKKSKNRFDHMNELLHSLSIPNTRIEAVNGMDTQLVTKFATLHTKMTPLEIACTLSHVMAINTLKNLPGEFFMVCEDDCCLENLRYFDITLFDIIKNAPYFEILMIYHSCTSELAKEYMDWNMDVHKSNSPYSVAGAVAYIIRKSCVQSFPNFNVYSIPNDFDLADKYIYRKAKTIVYKYNFITTLCKDSTIHENHLQDHKTWKANQLEIIQKNLNSINRNYNSCNIFLHYYAQKYDQILNNFKQYKIVYTTSNADIIIYHELDDDYFEYNQKYNILIKSSEQSYLHPYNCILNESSDLVITKDYYLSHTNWLTAN